MCGTGSGASGGTRPHRDWPVSILPAGSDQLDRDYMRLSPLPHLVRPVSMRLVGQSSVCRHAVAFSLRARGVDFSTVCFRECWTPPPDHSPDHLVNFQTQPSTTNMVPHEHQGYQLSRARHMRSHQGVIGDPASPKPSSPHLSWKSALAAHSRRVPTPLHTTSYARTHVVHHKRKVLHHIFRIRIQTSDT